MSNNSSVTNQKFSFKFLIISFWPSFLWGIIILILSLISGEQAKKISFLKFEHADKLAHLGLYFIFSYLIMFGFKKFYLNEIFKHRKQAIFSALIISVIFGALMEFLQMYLKSNREAELYDFVANSIGTIIAIILFETLDKIFRKMLALVKS